MEMIVLMLNEDDGNAEIAFGVLDHRQIALQLHALELNRKLDDATYEQQQPFERSPNATRHATGCLVAR